MLLANVTHACTSLHAPMPPSPQYPTILAPPCRALLATPCCYNSHLPAPTYGAPAPYTHTHVIHLHKHTSSIHTNTRHPYAQTHVIHSHKRTSSICTCTVCIHTHPLAHQRHAAITPAILPGSPCNITWRGLAAIRVRQAYPAVGVVARACRNAQAPCHFL